jgi:hypothetical protein
MAIKIHQAFPLVEGIIIKKKQGHVLTDLGQEKIKMQRRLLVYREEPVKHPVTGKLLGTDMNIVGKARVTELAPEMSEAELIDCKEELIEVFDKVITE